MYICDILIIMWFIYLSNVPVLCTSILLVPLYLARYSCTEWVHTRARVSPCSQGSNWMLTKYTISQSADLGFGPTNLRTQKFLKDTPQFCIFSSVVHAEFCAQ